MGDNSLHIRGDCLVIVGIDSLLVGSTLDLKHIQAAPEVQRGNGVEGKCKRNRYEVEYIGRPALGLTGIGENVHPDYRCCPCINQESEGSIF